MILFFDACALIYRFEGLPAFQAAAARVVAAARLEHPQARPACSRLSRLECRVKPLRQGDQALLARYERFFADPGLCMAELDAGVIEHATRLRAATGLKTPDALHAACALALASPVLFITGDAGFDRVTGLDVRRILV